MSSNHKAPLAAFVVVAIACVVVLATNSMRSYARDAWRSFAAPVVSGLSLLPTGHHDEPAKAVVASEKAAVAGPTVVSSGPTLTVVTSKHHHRGNGVHRAAGVASAATQPSGTVGTVNTAPTTKPAPPKPATQKPATSYPPAHGAFGEHHGWSQGQHNGWSHTQHSGPAFTSYGTSRGHGNSSHLPFKSMKSSHMTHGPSWKSTKSHTGSGSSKATATTSGFSHGNSSHGYGSNGHGYGAGSSHHGWGH